jgi:hypothetical protein
VAGGLSGDAEEQGEEGCGEEVGGFSVVHGGVVGAGVWSGGVQVTATLSAVPVVVS